jgi:ELWxxDGT repeat protein
MPAKRSLTAAIVLLLAVAIPVRGATPPTLQQIDLRPMADSSNPGDLVSFAGKIFFSANDGTNGQELWRTDGAPDATHAGTEIACDIRPGAGLGSNPYNLTVLGDWLYFSADSGETRNDLYRTNGSINGCERIGSTFENMENPRVVGDQLWFSANSSDGAEPWMTTSAGTPAQVANINPSGSSYPSEFTKLGSYVYFWANNGTDGFELWKSNGTGATMVANINETTGEGSGPGGLIAVGNTLWFAAYAPSTGTELMHVSASGYDGYFDINDGSNNSDPEKMTNFNGRLYFTAFTEENGTELWRVTSNGTSVERVTDINPGTNSSFPQFLTPIGDWLYFNANDGSNGNELWRTNGTTTELVKDIFPGTSDSYPFGFTERNGVLFFQAYTGVKWTIFQTTGTAATTVEAVTGTGTNPFIGCECYTPIVFLGDRAFTYSSNDEFGWEVAFFDPLLPNTNRADSGLSTALIIVSALTAAAGLTVRMRATK